MASGKCRALLLPVFLALVLAICPFLFSAISQLPASQETVLRWSFLVAALGVLLWSAALWVAHKSKSRVGRGLVLDIRIIRPHWVQLLAQGTVIFWWGWFVRPVYQYVPLILAQLALAVAVEALFAWSRRGRHNLGFGPVPVVFSLNLFLWFHLDWFFFQLAMVVLVYVGKEFIRWQVAGQSRHIFNPSAFALAVAALALIATGQTGITQGVEIAQSQYVPPYIFLVIFLAALPGQAIFGVATMTMPAVLTIFGFSAAYFQITGVYFFYDAYIPIAVFLGLHLLFTDPATSPRSELGRVIFGVLYGTGVVLSVFVLNAMGAPPFYDKLLPVPILNLAAPWLDRVATVLANAIGKPGIAAATSPPPRRRWATTGLWAAVFAALSLGGALGDDHPGQYYPFWRNACDSDNVRACDYIGIMQQNFCDMGSGWACNEFGVLMATADRNFRGASGEFQRACDLGFAPGCHNLEVLAGGGPELLARDEPPPVSELPIVLRGSKGPITKRDPDALFALACERGWREVEWGCAVEGRD